MSPGFTDDLPVTTAEVLPEPAGFGPPLHRQMTEDERRGFTYACQAMQLWGGICSKSRLPGDASTGMISLDEANLHGWRMVSNCAKALEVTMGRAA